MNIYILDIDPEEIKNPIAEGSIGDIRGERQVWERCKQAILSHAKKIDIDELYQEWKDIPDHYLGYDKGYGKISFPSFLREKLGCDTKEG
jgi:hypothetical protein